MGSKRFELLLLRWRTFMNKIFAFAEKCSIECILFDLHTEEWVESVSKLIIQEVIKENKYTLDLPPHN
jgi:hypothetical protein